MKYLKSFNESRTHGYDILPDNALEELKMYVDYTDKRNKVEVCPDPRVDGTYAVRVFRHKDKYPVDLIWHHGGYDEVEFESFPPKSGEPKFFI